MCPIHLDLIIFYLKQKYIKTDSVSVSFYCVIWFVYMGLGVGATEPEDGKSSSGGELAGVRDLGEAGLATLTGHPLLEAPGG